MKNLKTCSDKPIAVLMNSGFNQNVVVMIKSSFNLFLIQKKILILHNVQFQALSYYVS